MRPTQLLGVSGVGSHERHEARLWAKRLEWPMLLVVFWIPIQWYLEETGAITLQHGRIGDWIIWLIFLAETVLLTSLVRDKQRYLKDNWMNVLIIVGGLPALWHSTPLAGLLRSMRLVLALVLLFRLSKTLRTLLVRYRLGATLGIAASVVLLAGIAITRIEPGIGSVWDGMWWAWVTVATVGYGDIVPHTPAGRMFGALLILLGVVIVSLLTASLSAFLIGGEVEKVEREERHADALLKNIAERLERIEQRLQVIESQSGSPRPGGSEIR